MKAILIPFILLIAETLATTGTLTGRWQTKPSEKGNITSVVFKPDNSFEGFVNKKPFASGTYTFKDGVFSFVDNGCNGMKGIYKIIFFANNDSMLFQSISDSCTKRKDGMNRLVLGRVK